MGGHSNNYYSGATPCSVGLIISSLFTLFVQATVHMIKFIVVCIDHAVAISSNKSSALSVG